MRMNRETIETINDNCWIWFCEIEILLHSNNFNIIVRIQFNSVRLLLIVRSFWLVNILQIKIANLFIVDFSVKLFK